MLATEQLSIGYLQKKSRIELHKNLNFEFKRGGVTSILGVNGSGKTTLLLTLAGLHKQLNGEIRVSGQLMSSLSFKQLSILISIVLTKRISQKNMTVFELVNMGRHPYGDFFGNTTDPDKRFVENALNFTGIISLKDRELDTLSDGELQKAMISKCLAQNTPFIILDEPTAFLDSPSKVEILSLLNGIARDINKCIIFTTHEIGLAVDYSDQMIILGKNQNSISGNPDALVKNGFINSFFDKDDVHFDPTILNFRKINKNFT